MIVSIDVVALTTEEMMATVEDTLDATATATGHDRTPDVSEMTFSKSDSMMNNENTSAAFVENLEDLSQASIPKGDEMGGVGSSSSPSDATHKPKTRKEKYRKTLRLSSDAIVSIREYCWNTLKLIHFLFVYSASCRND